MKMKITAFAAALLFGASTLLAQGSGTTTTTTTATATATKTTKSTKSTKKSSYRTIHHVNGVVTARSGGAITIKSGTKSRQFTVNKGTRFVGTEAAKGAKVKISYRANTPRVAFEVRHRG